MFLALDPPEIGRHIIIEIPRARGEHPMVVAGRIVRRVVTPEGPRPSGAGIEITARPPEWTAFCAGLALTSSAERSEP